MVLPEQQISLAKLNGPCVQLLHLEKLEQLFLADLPLTTAHTLNQVIRLNLEGPKRKVN